MMTRNDDDNGDQNDHQAILNGRGRRGRREGIEVKPEKPSVHIGSFPGGDET